MRQRIVLQPVKKPTGTDIRLCVKDYVLSILLVTFIVVLQRQSHNKVYRIRQFVSRFHNTTMPESAEMFFDSINPSSIQDWDPDKSIRKQYRFGK